MVELKQANHVVRLHNATHRNWERKAKNAVSEIRDFAVKHTRLTDVRVANEVNEALWARGMYTIPSTLAVTLVPFEKTVRVYLKDSKQIELDRKALQEKAKEKTAKPAAAKPEDEALKKKQEEKKALEQASAKAELKKG